MVKINLYLSKLPSETQEKVLNKYFSLSLKLESSELGKKLQGSIQDCEIDGLTLTILLKKCNNTEMVQVLEQM